jgi:Holliday junction DNA helicase RuvB
MSDDERLISGSRRRDDRENIALRPKLLRDIVGQESVRENLKILIGAAQARKEPIARPVLVKHLSPTLLPMK